MKKPEMIIFDYGHTLLYEPHFDAMRCEEAAYSYIIENPQSLTVEQYCGDSIKADVKGAHEAGIYPVLYEGNTPDEENFSTQKNEGKTVDFDYLHIRDWKELIALFQLCRQ